MDSMVPTRRVSLLETVLSDAALIERLSQSKSVSLTLTLEIDPDGNARFQHPDLFGLNPDAPNDDASNEGFVPSRAIMAPGERSDADTEYRLVGKIGSGGTGIVYQAHQRAIDREVAVKVLRGELSTDALSRKRFLQEARTLGSLDHPNVIAIHELGTGSGGELFYAMKRVDGTSWDASIDQMTQNENVEVLLRVADALRYAHSRSLIHRDIKPENVMIGPFGEVLVADWGLALFYDGGSSGTSNPRTVNQSIGGTPAYMAPELADGDVRSQTVKTDVYLLGAVLYRILTGHPPHDGATLLECIKNAASNVIVPTTVRNGWVEVAMEAMATNPLDRYADVSAFVDAIAAQQLHQQSDDLLRRAKKLVAKPSDLVTHQDYSVAEALIREAIDVFPGHRDAIAMLSKIQAEHARVAAAHGDFDLAITLLEDIGMSDSELAARFRREQEQRHEQASREAKYSALFTRSPDAGLLTRARTAEIVEANDQFARLTGYSPQDVVAKRIPDISVWACPSRRGAFIDELTENGHVEDFETPIFRKDGSVLEASLSANRFAMNGEEFILTTIRDVGPRKQAQLELKQSQIRLRELQNLAQLGTWESNVKTGVVTWSDETFVIAGRPAEHGAPNFDEYVKTVHPEDRALIVDAIETSLKHHTAYELQLRHLRSDGTYNTVIARGQPTVDNEGNVTHLYGVVIDITRQVAELELLRRKLANR